MTGRYPGLYLVSYSAVLIAMCWMAIWIFGAAGAVSIPYGAYYVVLLIISLAWSIEVLRNTVNITVAGTVGTFYFQVDHHTQSSSTIGCGLGTTPLKIRKLNMVWGGRFNDLRKRKLCSTDTCWSVLHVYENDWKIMSCNNVVKKMI